VGAARAGHVEIVRALLDAGAPVNPVRPGPQTPLHAAVATNNLELVKLLLAHGADLEAVNAMGQSSLELATTYRYPGHPTAEAIVEALCEAAASLGQGGSRSAAESQTGPKAQEPNPRLKPTE
jgi:ankyrin repeat protein